MKLKNTGNNERLSYLVSLIRQIKDGIANPQKCIAGLLTFFIMVIPPLLETGLGPRRAAGLFVLYTLLFCLSFFCLCSYRSTGRRLSNNEFYLLCSLAVVYFIAADFSSGIQFYKGSLPASVFMPTALIILLMSIMVTPRYARTLSLLLPLGALITQRFDTDAFVFALASGISAAFVLQGAKTRIDLVRAGCVVALINVITAAALLTWHQPPLSVYPAVLGFAVINGIASGMLVLGITPVLENMLHTATTFRLIELLDLGAPLMRLLESKTPGTYNHSIVVANLAEAACREIGAGALLARVGAYYHDIGKIDQPEYFVENQRAGNKHDDINPRLSATVIRSHVKLGIEKGRAAGLPNDVIDIIANHHGNSLITYFYYAALKKEGNVEMTDFCYPGHPPQTKESAVVMLADITEAAVRTLDKPSTGRLEKFINELVAKKIDSSQLSQSELTFRDLETIKKVFVRVLASYYHSRIEYPNQNKPVSKDDE